MAIELHKEKSSGAVRTVTIGATKEQGGTRAGTLTLGGETALPFLDFEGVSPHRPALALEIRNGPAGGTFYGAGAEITAEVIARLLAAP